MFDERNELTRTQRIAKHTYEENSLKKHRKRIEILKNITNNNYYRVENIDKLQ